MQLQNNNEINKGDESFTYMYSAKQQDEIKAIKLKYIPKEENKMEQLRRLDKNTELKGIIPAVIVGLIGAILVGIGLTCTLVWADRLFIPGIIIGVLGSGIVAMAYPLHERIIKKERAKIAPTIMRLLEELEK